MAGKRKWTIDQKIKIIEEAQIQGKRKTLKIYNLSSSVFYRWKNSYDKEGVRGLSRKNVKRETNSRFQYQKKEENSQPDPQLEARLELYRELAGKLSIDEIPISERKALMRKYNQRNDKRKIKLRELYDICQVTKRQYFNKLL